MRVRTPPKPPFTSTMTMEPEDITRHPGFIIHSQVFDDYLAKMVWGAERKEASALLNDKKFSAGHTDIEYRVLNHWAGLKLLEDERGKNSQAWRKLSLTEIVWLRVIKVLREYGLSLKKVRQVQQALMVRDGRPLTVLEIAICLCTKRLPIFVVVLADGNADIADPASLELTDRWLGYHHHIRICLNNIVREIIGVDGDDLKPIPPRLTGLSEGDRHLLNEKEKELLQVARSGKNDELHVLFRDGEIFQIDETKMVEGARSIADALTEINYGEINIKIENGRKFTKSTNKKRLK